MLLTKSGDASNMVYDIMNFLNILLKTVYVLVRMPFSYWSFLLTNKTSVHPYSCCASLSHTSAASQMTSDSLHISLH